MQSRIIFASYLRVLCPALSLGDFSCLMPCRAACRPGWLTLLHSSQSRRNVDQKIFRIYFLREKNLHKNWELWITRSDIFSTSNIWHYFYGTWHCWVWSGRQDPGSLPSCPHQTDQVSRTFVKTTQLLIKIWNLFFSRSISYWNVDTDSGVDSGLQMEKSKSNSE